jgi:hypothetical protein
MSCKFVHHAYIRPRDVDIDIDLGLHWTPCFTALSRYEDIFTFVDRSYMPFLLHTITEVFIKQFHHSSIAIVDTNGLVVAPLITLLVHVLGVLLGVVMGLLAVNPVHTLGLGELVDFATDDAGDKFLGKGVADWLACLFKSKSEDWPMIDQIGNVMRCVTYPLCARGPRRPS